MRMLPNEEQTILKRSAQEFFQARSPVKALRALRDARDANGFDRALWRDMADLGWAGILVPEAYGGAAFGYKGLGQVLEEAGRTLVASPLVATALIGAPLLAASASEAQRETLLPAVATGESLLTLAIDELPRHAPTHIATRASADGAGYRLSGSKTFVLDGHVADWFIVVARTAGGMDDVDGISLFLVAAGAPGITCSRTPMVDSRNAATLRFDNVALGADALLGTAGQGQTLLEPVLDGARIGLAAEMLGSGQEAFDRTLAYLKLRRQFDQPIGAFQALKHRAALMYCELELTRSAVLEALGALDEGRRSVAMLASLAKAKACDMFELVSAEAVQMHGGIGMTDAEEIVFFLKRARVAQQLFGDAVFHRARYATLAGF